MRRVRKYPQQLVPGPVVYDYRDRNLYAPPIYRNDYYAPRVPVMLYDAPRGYRRRDLAIPKGGNVQPTSRRPIPGVSQGKMQKGPKKTRVAKKRTEKQERSKEDLDGELDKYMGNESLKKRLDDELSRYIDADDDKKGER